MLPVRYARLLAKSDARDREAKHEWLVANPYSYLDKVSGRARMGNKRRIGAVLKAVLRLHNISDTGQETGPYKACDINRDMIGQESEGP